MMHLEYRMTTGRATTKLDLVKRIQLPVLDAVAFQRRVRKCTHIIYDHTFEEFLIHASDVMLWKKSNQININAVIYINFSWKSQALSIV